ncbi:MAG: AAA family ATPase [Acidobacteriota bacterium]
MSQATESLRRAFIGRAPVLFVSSVEEERAVTQVTRVARKINSSDCPVHRWSVVRGWYESGTVSNLDGEEDLELTAGEDRSALAALATATQGRGAGVFFLHDLDRHFDDPAVVRAVREATQTLQRTDRHLVVTSSAPAPTVLDRELFFVDLGLPEVAELERLVERFRRSYPDRGIDDALARDMALGLRGLDMLQAEQALNRVFRRRSLEGGAVLDEIFADKQRAVRKAGFLEYVPASSSIGDIGGLENLNGWLERRKRLFSQEALAEGLPVPKGMLVMGMSGCGKSLAAKVVSHHWGIPLFRLDMNLVSSGLYGTPEAAFDRALKTVEGLAPAVLWIDEIENSLGMDGDEHQGNARVFSSFLTWMQEKPPFIFVAATANRISALPAEVIRKGRFDQVFFVDLPTLAERSAIFQIHLERQGADLGEFDLELLAIATKGWNGAEIEQAVAAARIDAYDEERAMQMQDVTRNTGSIVPLSKTMHEQMKQIRSWAFGRATLASSERFSESESVALG